MLSVCLGAFVASATGATLVGLGVGLASFTSVLVPQTSGALLFALNAKNITWPQGRENPGGIGSMIYYAFEEDILSWPAAATPDTETATTFAMLGEIPIGDPFVFKTGKCFFELYCTLEEGEVKHAMVGPRDSKGFENSVDISFPGSDAELIGFLAAAANRRIVCLVPEMNGKVRLIGHPRFPAQIDTNEGTSGKKVADGRANKITIKASAGTPPQVYLAPIPLTPAA